MPNATGIQASVTKKSGSWNGNADVKPQPNGNVWNLPSASVAAGSQTISRASNPGGKVLVVGSPASPIALAMIISSDSSVPVTVGSSPYNNGVVVLFI